MTTIEGGMTVSEGGIMWTTGYNGDIRRAAHGYEPTREAAMAAFAKSWRRESI
jgi:hypothetical protein